MGSSTDPRIALRCTKGIIRPSSPSVHPVCNLRTIFLRSLLALLRHLLSYDLLQSRESLLLLPDRLRLLHRVKRQFFDLLQQFHLELAEVYAPGLDFAGPKKEF